MVIAVVVEHLLFFAALLLFFLIPAQPGWVSDEIARLELYKEESARHCSGARGPPQFLKKRSENAGAHENFSCAFPPIPGIPPRVAPRIVAFALLKS